MARTSWGVTLRKVAQSKSKVGSDSCWLNLETGDATKSGHFDLLRTQLSRSPNKHACLRTPAQRSSALSSR